MKDFKCKIWDKATSTMWLPEDSNHINIHPNGSVSINGIWSTNDVDILLYTGLEDENGVDIFEGAVVRILYTDWPSQSPEENGRYSMNLDDYKKSISKIGSVVWNRAEYGVHFGSSGIGSIHPGQHGEIEVIGDIHQNPELLNG